ncbi:hypothetical protein KHP60_21990 [Microvirga sp. 3-52]|jgi:hypothetical protein|nr:hypothetical protein [Microvirga sp. 3-52]MBO1909180.1 hypothetical protein [Microvirga sp. 3-52]MBS7454978.1 hypothetical protein [Microvirga sp. 3-52]
MADDDDKLLVARAKSPVNDRLSRVLEWFGLLVALGAIAWAILYTLG